jgi:predicted amidophosphoribosyltransferase
MFCTNCGKEILEDPYFCPNCGVRTKRGVQAEISIPKERRHNWEQELEKAGREMGKAFTTAGKEVEKAFKTAMDRIKEPYKETVVCPHCEEKLSSGSIFCYKCGKKLT